MIGHSIFRAVVAGVRAAKMQMLQVQQGKDGAVDEAEHFEPHGLTSRPAAGAEVIVLCVEGSESHPIVIAAADRRYRVADCAAGETVLYNNAGHRVELRNERVVIKAPDIRLGSANASAAVGRVGDSVTIDRGDNTALFAILDAAATLASLPPVDQIVGEIASGSTVVKAD